MSKLKKKSIVVLVGFGYVLEEMQYYFMVVIF